jgi:N-dimethylarginine dimethylaminohydrolase
MNNTCHSETGRITSIFIKRAGEAFISQEKLDQEFEALQYISRPNFKKAKEEYDAFESQLRSTGATIHCLPEGDGLSIDSIYCRDAAIATDFGMIICNMGKVGRVNEPAAEHRAFDSTSIPVLGIIQAPGTVEGGDVAWLDAKTLAVGHTYRTNEEGIRQLEALLNPHDIEVLSFSLPHYKGEFDVFHLMSIFSPVDTDIAVVYSPLMPISFRNELKQRGYQLVEVPEEEFDSMGCNVLALEPKKCLMVKGNPVTRTRLENLGCTVLDYPGEEISVKGGGGPTCLTRPILREK